MMDRLLKRMPPWGFAAVQWFVIFVVCADMAWNIAVNAMWLVAINCFLLGFTVHSLVLQRAWARRIAAMNDIDKRAEAAFDLMHDAERKFTQAIQEGRIEVVRVYVGKPDSEGDSNAGPILH